MQISPTGTPVYLYEARQRMGYYPPRAPPSSYYTPWLWLDGNQSPGYNTGSWSTYITSRLSQASPITESIWGSYNPQTGTGTVYARFQNDSNATVNANVVVVVTEDNITYLMPNGDNTHNHVARDYIPSYTGEPVTIAPGSSVTLNYPFTIASSWSGHNIEVVGFIQNQTLINNAKEILQGAMRKLDNFNFIGIEEPRIDIPITQSTVKTLPNPSVNGTNFAFSLPSGTHYKISIFNAAGRNIRTLTGIATGKNDLVQWHPEVQAGIYLYRFESNTTNTSGKIIVN